MSTPSTPEKSSAPKSHVPCRVTTFLKPCYGITIQSNTLCVAVSVQTQEGQGTPPPPPVRG